MRLEVFIVPEPVPLLARHHHERRDGEQDPGGEEAQGTHVGREDKADVGERPEETVWVRFLVPFGELWEV